MPGMVNVRAAPAVKVPADIVTVNTPAAMVLVPAPPTPPAVKVRVPGEATASPAPLSVMTILPSVGMRVVGVRDTVMMTPPAPLTALLREIAGLAAPSVLVTMAAVSKATDNTLSALVFIRKPPDTMTRAPPRLSPVSVIVTAAVPVAAPPVVSTIEVLVAVAAGDDVAVKGATVLAMEKTDPKK